MKKKLSDLMTPNPVMLPASSTLHEAAQTMARREIGDVIVTDGDSAKPCGMVTDRDLVVRGLAQGLDPETATLGEICSRELICLSPSDSADEAVNLMRTRSIRRLPVMDKGTVVGMVSLGDLAIDRDPESALADISRAPSNA